MLVAVPSSQNLLASQNTPCNASAETVYTSDPAEFANQLTL